MTPLAPVLDGSTIEDAVTPELLERLRPMQDQLAELVATVAPLVVEVVALDRRLSDAMSREAHRLAPLAPGTTDPQAKAFALIYDAIDAFRPTYALLGALTTVLSTPTFANLDHARQLATEAAR